MAPSAPLSFASVLMALEGAGEATRLRLLALLTEAELTVTEVVSILGQSQPRVSRHLKLLVEAGLVERHREGAWAFFSCGHGETSDFARDLVRRLDAADPILSADRARLAEVRSARNASADAYFASQATRWDLLRSLHVAEEQVEAALLRAIGPGPFGAILDLGTGTGRMLELLAPRARRAVGIDQSHAMLNVARSRIAKGGLRNVQVRQGDIYALPVERDGYDVVIVHQVLHFLDDPSRAVREAARALVPGGVIAVVDFAPHGDEDLREHYAHRRLGFSRGEIDGFMHEAGLDAETHLDLAPQSGEPHKLIVSIWIGRDRRPAAPVSDHSLQKEVA